MRTPRLALVTICALALAFTAHHAGSQGKAKDMGPQFPERPMRMLVPFAAGGNTDILARAVGTRISENWASRSWSTTGRAARACWPPRLS